MGQRTLNREELDSVRATMRRLKAPDRVEGMIAARVEEALDALQELNVPAPAEAALTALAHSASARLS